MKSFELVTGALQASFVIRPCTSLLGSTDMHQLESMQTTLN